MKLVIILNLNNKYIKIICIYTIYIMKLFHLIQSDKILCEGVIFEGGKVIVHWLGDVQSYVYWDSIKDFEKISGSILDRKIVYLN